MLEEGRDEIAAAASIAAQPTNNKRRLIAKVSLFLIASRYIILLLLFLLGIRTALHTFLHRNMYSSSVTNTLCSQITSTDELKRIMLPRKSNASDVGDVFKEKMHTWSLSEQNNLIEQYDICNIPEKYQFKKFLWFLTDGLPVKYSKKTLDHYASNSILYTIDIPGPKYSHAIYTSYLTGQLPTNYQGKPITGDSLLKSMQRSSSIGPLTYIGPEWSFLAISGKQNYNHLFKRIIDKPEPLDQPHDRAYRFFFQDTQSREWFWKTLDYIAAEEGSLFTHSAIFDHINHGIFRNNPTNTKYLDFLSNRIADDINALKGWIDKHPDYLLILSSDHGCDDVSNGYVLHGYSTNGNEGYVMLYNPSLTKHSERVDVVDIAPTIAKYLDKVDIPADNIGVTRVYYGDTPEALISKEHALKQNLMQIADTSKRRGVPNVKLDIISNLLKMTVEKSAGFKDQEQLNKKLGSMLHGMKMNLYKLLHKPYNWVLYYALQAFIVITFLLYKYNYYNLVLMAKGYIIKGIKNFLLLIPMYFGAFIHVLFVWDTYKNLIRSGGPFYVWHFYLVLIVFYSLLRVGIASEGKEKAKLIDVGKKFLYHTLIDMTWFMLFTLLRSQWKVAFDQPELFYIPYILMVAFIILSSNISITGILLLPFRIVRKIIGKPLQNNQNQKMQTKDYVHLFISISLFLLLILFEITSAKGKSDLEEKERYIIFYRAFGFHIFFAVFLALIAIYFFVILLFCTNDLDRLIVPATLYAFAIMRDIPYGRILTLALNLQYFLLLVPMMQKVNSLSAAQRRQFNRNASSQQTEKLASRSLSTAYAWDFLQLALTLFFLNQPFYQFVVGKEEKLNVDAHPFAGAVGMRSHQEYPSFNAFQMAYEKWHTILIFALFLWKVIFKNTDENAAPKNVLSPRKVDQNANEKEEDKVYIIDMILTQCALMLFNANLFLQLLLCFISMNHPFEDSVVYLIVVSVIGASFITFILITEYFSIRKMLQFILRHIRGVRTPTGFKRMLSTASSYSKDKESLLPLDEVSMASRSILSSGAGNGILNRGRSTTPNDLRED
jgi:hypothetical protein